MQGLGATEAAALSAWPHWSTPGLHFSRLFIFKLENEHMACSALRRTHSEHVEVVPREHLCQCECRGKKSNQATQNFLGKLGDLRLIFFFNLFYYFLQFFHLKSPQVTSRVIHILNFTHRDSGVWLGSMRESLWNARPLQWWCKAANQHWWVTTLLEGFALHLGFCWWCISPLRLSFSLTVPSCLTDLFWPICCVLHLHLPYQMN